VDSPRLTGTIPGLITQAKCQLKFGGLPGAVTHDSYRGDARLNLDVRAALRKFLFRDFLSHRSAEFRFGLCVEDPLKNQDPPPNLRLARSLAVHSNNFELPIDISAVWS